jgi:hypothetical protein
MVLAPFSVSTASANGPEQVEETAVVKVVVLKGEDAIRHPGLEAYVGEATEFEMRVGKVKHVVVVHLANGPENKYDIKVTYKRNGKEVISGKKTVKSKERAKFKKGDVQVFVVVDPNGKIGNHEKIEGPKGDNPLD